jgi:AcrR family transcriptional regulator
MPATVRKVAHKPRAARATAAPPRRPGRPAGSVADRHGAAALLSREQILARAAELAKAEPLAELSIVRLARELGVTPALIHYYVGSRDDLISGVVNRYFKARVEGFGTPSGDWRRDLERIARVTYELMIEYGGVLRYILTHNRFRLFQKVGPGETDYGLEFFDHFARVFRDAGFGPREGALGYHLLMQFVLSSAFAQVSRQLPIEHERFVYEHLTAQSASRHPGAHYLASTFSQLDAETAYREGLRILLDGFTAWPRKSGTDHDYKFVNL